MKIEFKEHKGVDLLEADFGNLVYYRNDCNQKHILMKAFFDNKKYTKREGNPYVDLKTGNIIYIDDKYGTKKGFPVESELVVWCENKNLSRAIKQLREIGVGDVFHYRLEPFMTVFNIKGEFVDKTPCVSLSTGKITVFDNYTKVNSLDVKLVVKKCGDD